MHTKAIINPPPRTESKIEAGYGRGHVRSMPMSVEQIVREARHLSQAQLAELLERLLVEAIITPDPEIDAAWKNEIRHRLAEVKSGQEPGVDGDEVMAELRQIVGR